MPAYIIMILISFIASIIPVLLKKNIAALRYFPVFLLLSFIVEYISWKMGNTSQNNIFIYNLFSVFEFIFYFFFLRSIINHFYTKKIILYAIIVYLILALLNIFFIQGKNTFHTYTYILGSLFIVILCIVYFNFLFRFTKSESLVRDPLFWIVTGLLFSFTFSLPVLGINNFVIKMPSRFYRILGFMIDFMNISLYLLFTIGFLCRINIRKLLRLS